MERNDRSSRVFLETTARFDDEQSPAGKCVKACQKLKGIYSCCRAREEKIESCNCS